MTDFYDHPSRNPAKVALFLEESGLPYQPLFRALCSRLRGHEYMGGDYPIADIANWARGRTQCWPGVENADLPHLTRWVDTTRARPAVQKGITTPPSALHLCSDAPNSAKQFAEDALKMVETDQSQ